MAVDRFTQESKKNEFTKFVYEWLLDPKNNEIVDYHESLLSLKGRKKGTKIIEEFWEQKFIQQYPNEEVDPRLIHSCAIEYIKEFV